MKRRTSPEMIGTYITIWFVAVGSIYLIVKDSFGDNQPLILTLTFLIPSLIVLAFYLVTTRTSIFDLLAFRIRPWFGGKRGKYLNKIFYRHMNLEDRNLGVMRLFSLPLNEVYIDLQMIPISGKDDPLMSGLLVYIDDKTRENAQSIWRYIQTPSSRPNHFVIIGNPGSGKSTLLRHVALTLASNVRVRKKFHAPNKMPVLISLREHWRKIAQAKSITLDTLLKEDFKNSDIQLPEDWCANGMKNGDLIIMLDGLDEIPDTNAQAKIFRWVENLLENAAKCSVIITTRPHGYQKYQLSNVTSLFIAPLTKHDASLFINNWYIQAEYLRTKMTNSEVRNGAIAKAESLIHRIGLRRLWELAANPMLLNMIILIDWTGTELPAKRAGLFQKIFEVFLEDYPRAKGLTVEIQADDGIKILSPLAYSMMQKQQLLIDLNEAAQIVAEPLSRTRLSHLPEEFLKRIEQLSGIFVDTGDAQYTFAHRSFQEFLAAEYVKEQGVESELLENLEENWWHETILLYAVRKDGTNVINACLRKTNNIEVLKLAITCNEEASVSPETRKLLETVLYEKLDDTNIQRRRVVIEALIESQFNPLTIGEKSALLSAPVTNAMYNAFLDDCDKEHTRYAPDHWNTHMVPSLVSNEPIMGVRPSDDEAFCVWLNNRPRTRWHYRMPNPTEARSVKGPLRFWAKHAQSEDYPYECIERLEEREFFIREKINHIARKDFEDEARKMISKNHLDLDHFFKVFNRSAGNISSDQVLSRSIFHQIKEHYSPRTAENLESALKTDTVSPNQEEREIFARNLSGVLVETFDEIFNTRYVNRHKTDDLADALAGRFSMAIGHVLQNKLIEDTEGPKKNYDSKHLDRLNELNAQMKDYLHLYVQLELLKLRIRDKMQPMEGIVVVIENKESAKN